MSTLPQMFRSVQSVYIKPAKQGGIYAIKRNTIHYENQPPVQPQQFMSLKVYSNTESRIGTSHSMRSKKVVSFAEDARIVASSESRRRASSQRTSRQTSLDVRKDIFNNYGNKRVSFAIGEPLRACNQQVQSLIRKMNEQFKHIEEIQKQINQTIKQQYELRYELKQVAEHTNKQIQSISQTGTAEFKRLRQLLSELRRRSGMETKVNKIDASELQNQLQNIRQVMNGIGQQARELQTLCIK